jgi:protein associated with RNAse G/E
VNEPNNGLNKKSSNYSLKEGYELVVIVEANVASSKGIPITGILTNYQFLSQPHAYYDYDLDNNVTPDWAVEILTIDENGINTNGVIQTSINTTIQATF